jgi:hypothetical protein
VHSSRYYLTVKLVAALTLLLAVYVSRGSLAVRALISVAAVLIVFRHDLFGCGSPESGLQVALFCNALIAMM